MAQLFSFVTVSQIDIPNAFMTIYLIHYQTRYLNSWEEYMQNQTLLTDYAHLENPQFNFKTIRINTKYSCYPITERKCTKSLDKKQI